MPEKANSSDIPVVVDMFCGAGGLTYGLQSAGCQVAVGVDLDPDSEYPITQNTEAKFVQKDVCDITSSELETWFGDSKVRVLAGCAPCQPFSSYSFRYRKEGQPENGKWKLLLQFQRLALAVKPEIVTMENVPGLEKQDIWKDFVSALEKVGYEVSFRVVKCEEFGIPQKRRRLVLLASLFGKIELDNPILEKIPNVREAISHLPPIEAGGGSKKDRLHAAASLKPINLERIQHSRPGGTWRDWPEDLRADCHKKSSGKSYPSVYGRMEWDKPSPTMTTQCYGYGNGRFGHPEQDRAISLREAAILQSFPKHYKFIHKNKAIPVRRLGTLIGNAVPPKLGEAIGLCIREHVILQGYCPSSP